MGVSHIPLQCPNKQAIFIENHNEIVSEGEDSDEEQMPPLEYISDNGVYYSVKEEALGSMLIWVALFSLLCVLFFKLDLWKLINHCLELNKYFKFQF